ncbi:hypothetical protein CHK_1261 [Christensenella hongkongensis]|uniref:Uncharacterized protein n=1 Tax=Christensenella hongkongensis TaxID=270498 RepID=A0A0M2NFA7_9FIRM|nr:hypothetical protein CHK_1261 [Christensenella hongkongensis]
MAHARAYRIDILFVAPHGDFCTSARLARDALDLHDILADFRHLDFKQAFDERRMRTGHNNLRPLVCLFHLEHVYLDTVVDVILLRINRLAYGDNPLGASKLHIDIAALDPVDDRSQNLVFLFRILVVDNAAFRLPDTLHHHLFCGLRRNTSKITRRNFRLHHVSGLIFFVDFTGLLYRDFRFLIFDFIHNVFDRKHFDLAGIAVNLHACVLIRAKVSLVGRNKRRFDCFE